LGIIRAWTKRFKYRNLLQIEIVFYNSKFLLAWGIHILGKLEIRRAAAEKKQH
jgi:hypothetical protein